MKNLPLRPQRPKSTRVVIEILKSQPVPVPLAIIQDQVLEDHLRMKKRLSKTDKETLTTLATLLMQAEILLVTQRETSYSKMKMSLRESIPRNSESSQNSNRLRVEATSQASWTRVSKASKTPSTFHQVKAMVRLEISSLHYCRQSLMKQLGKVQQILSTDQGREGLAETEESTGLMRTLRRETFWRPLLITVLPRNLDRICRR